MHVAGFERLRKSKFLNSKFNLVQVVVGYLLLHVVLAVIPLNHFIYSCRRRLHQAIIYHTQRYIFPEFGSLGRLFSIG